MESIRSHSWRRWRWGAGADWRVQHVPLRVAIAELGNDVLGQQRLLAPLRRAATRNAAIGELVDSHEVFHAVAWTAAEAYVLLRATPDLQAAGIHVHVPDWWHAVTPRPQIRVQLGGGAPASLGLEALLGVESTLPPAPTGLVIAALAPEKVALTGGLAALFGLNLRGHRYPPTIYWRSETSEGPAMRLNSLLRACWVLALCAAPAFAFALADTSATLATAINIRSGPVSIEGLRSGIRGQPRYSIEAPPGRAGHTPQLEHDHPERSARSSEAEHTRARPAPAPARGEGPERRQDERDLRRPRPGRRDPLRRLGRAADHAPSTLRSSILTEMHRSSGEPEVDLVAAHFDGLSPPAPPGAGPRDRAAPGRARSPSSTARACTVAAPVIWVALRQDLA